MLGLSIQCSAAAQGPDGSTFLRACNAAVKQSDGGKVSDEEGVHSLYCIGYVSGFLDAMSLTVTTTGAKRNVCLPQAGITNDQAIRIFVKYLRDNPAILHETGRTSLYLALAKAFPCK
jgi:hypothetical protein